MSLARDREVASEAVREAGRIAMRYFRQTYDRWEKGPGQIVTEADIAVDRFLKERLLAHQPGDGWLSEESEDDRSRLGSTRVWIVDPIDGTRSFAEGVAEFTISVALVEDRRPVLGLVFNPATDEFFEAASGQGARLNGTPLRVSAQDRLEGASVVASRFESRRRGFATLLPSVELTTIGSLAYKLALVAAGRYDGYLSWRRSQDWDIAGAAVLLAEAGGVLSSADGSSIVLNEPQPTHPGLLAGSPALHRELLRATLDGWSALAAQA